MAYVNSERQLRTNTVAKGKSQVIQNGFFQSFKVSDFPDEAEYNVVYVLCVESLNNDFIPFYVGETLRSIAGRMGDYVRGKDADFKVGKAVEILRKTCPIKVLHIESDSDSNRRKKHERWLMAKIRAEFKNTLPEDKPLLNDLKRKSKKYTEVEIEEWVKTFLASLGKSATRE